MNIEFKYTFADVAAAISALEIDLHGLSLRKGRNMRCSPEYISDLFIDWIGVEPNVFSKYITIEYRRKMIRDITESYDSAIFVASFSKMVGLCVIPISIEVMTLNEYKNEGAFLNINYSFSASPFGDIIIATTSKGVCYLAFADTNDFDTVNRLKERFPKANCQQKVDVIQQNALSALTRKENSSSKLVLHLKGTDFQLKVWKTLLQIPVGQFTTYGEIASFIDQPRASRAVGTAIGNNPIAYLIPCHRVVRSKGELGGYHWGLVRKVAMIGWEGVKKTTSLF